VVELLHENGILDSSMLISHASNASVNDCRLLQEASSHVSCTPSTELQMAMTLPIAFQDNRGIQSQCSLGIDCQSNNSASMVMEMRLILQSSRNVHNEKFIKQGKMPRKVSKTVEEAFNLGTIQGARAIRMQDQIGSLAVGKKADILVFDAISPSMVCAAQHDPVAAVVLHSSPADIGMVIVDGVVKKRFRMLENVDLKLGSDRLWDGVKELGEQLTWNNVAKELIKRRTELQKKVDKLDMDAAKKGVIKAFYIDKSVIVDQL
jgi:cytosine/adenosine deaminase-related metal-dependent hydrolase